MIRFRSHINPNHVFLIQKPDSDHWMVREQHRYVAPWAWWHDTMGDGWTAHTPNGMVNAERINEFLLSLMRALSPEVGTSVRHDGLSLSDAQAETVRVMAAHYPREIDRKRAEWLCRLKHKPGLYFHLKDDKTSSSSDKRHDNRWSAVPEWCSGENDPTQVYSLLHWNSGYSRWSLERAEEWRQVHSLFGIWADFPTFYGKNGGGADHNTMNLVHALFCLVEGERLKERSARYLATVEQNMRNQAERS